MNYTKFAFLTSLTCMALLAGCSRGPSESDVNKAVRSAIEEENQTMRAASMGLLNLKVEVHEVKKLGCVAAEGAGGYVCDVEVDSSAPMVGRKKTVGKVRLVKTSDGWKATQ